MNRTTIDFGIDLGTTNSAIAVLRGTVAEIVQNNDHQDITASAVYIDKRGQTQTGYRAKSRLENESAADDVYVEFKRRMGTDHKYQFKSAARTMTPEDLSAEILKALRGDVQQRLSEEVVSAVITVPAAFEQRQCVATRKAGELAGLLQCPLLQEPVAAALAYGFQSDVTKEYWLVYDFGGGTFDAALIKAEDGTISVVNHGGDNFLGGSDIDWAIVENLIVPELAKNFNLPEFSRGHPRWRTAFGVLKRAAEDARTRLSRSATAYLEACSIKDATGKAIEVEIELCRDAVVTLAEPIIMRSIEICKRVLKEKNLGPSAVAKTILVGGPTLAPYFREMVQAGLGVQVDSSVDPLTVVARGAAIFAGTQRIEGKMVPKAVAGQYDVDLKYKPIGADEDPTVRGTVTAKSGSPMDGFTIEFANPQSHWRSGKIPLKGDGRFKTNLLAEKGRQNVFSIELLDPNGRRLVTVPDSLAYTMGLAISEQPINNPIGVGLANNVLDVLFKKGDTLPAKARGVYHSVHAVKKGSADHFLIVPIREGEAELADRNRLLGNLVVPGKNIRRDVPAGSEVEVTLYMDTSRIILAKAFIPILDEEFDAVIDTNRLSADPARLGQEYEQETKRLESLRNKAAHADDSKVEELLDEIEESDSLETFEGLIAAGKADPDAANAAEARLLEVKIKIDKAENALQWPALVAEATRAINALGALAEEHGAEEHKERLGRIRPQVDELIQQKRAEALRRKIEEVTDLHNAILFEQPGYWLGFFNYLVKERARIADEQSAERLIQQGEQIIHSESGNVQKLRNVVMQLWNLFPQEEVEAIQRDYSSLLK